MKEKQQEGEEREQKEVEGRRRGGGGGRGAYSQIIPYLLIFTPIPGQGKSCLEVGEDTTDVKAPYGCMALLHVLP